MAGQKTNGSASAAAATARDCPTCGRPAIHDFRPFCSRRCADIDLHRWLTGAYAVPVADDADEDGERPAESGPDSGKKPNED